ncbi:MAG TPA: aminoglycoside phosphotransferase family protein [Intrasporangium sp.]|uniref:aminoglycoside phosphotransferase family protein n=1 Tax=Intrasporangium sp. TaxID=1925024 RepID=UPI002B48CA73|nr:aminoglycoside phosphotransferase family protein [Intrasporangium sp.]HKX66148.1 aminoglycoside phosphotransferase family protein [Intrasporangium sp.]
MRLHADQLELSDETVAALVAEQLPDLRGARLSRVPSNGTVNLLHRLGEELVLRFPMQGDDPDTVWAELTEEADNARRLLGRLPVSSPEPVSIGEPGHGYPLPWAVYRWLPGLPASQADLAGSVPFAEQLASLVLALREIDTEGRAFMGERRGGRLSDHDAGVRRWLGQSHGLIDVPEVEALWARLARTPRDDAPDTWTHGDLMPDNLLVQGGRLSAVIDVGLAGPADPALDLQPAWNLLGRTARRAFREALAVGDAEWDRGKAWALAQASGCLPYYRVTNPPMSRLAHRTLTALLEDS